MQVNRCSLLFSVLHLSLCVPLSPSPRVHSSTCFPPRALSCTSSRRSCTPSLCSLPPLLAALHVSAERHRLLLSIIGSFRLCPASAPLVNQPVTISGSGPRRSSQRQKLPPTPWIIHESVSVFRLDWRVLTPDLRQSPGGWSSIVLLPRETMGPSGCSSNHSYQIMLSYCSSCIFRRMMYKAGDNLYFPWKEQNQQ